MNHTWGQSVKSRHSILLWIGEVLQGVVMTPGFIVQESWILEVYCEIGLSCCSAIKYEAHKTNKMNK